MDRMMGLIAADMIAVSHSTCLEMESNNQTKQKRKW